MANESPALQSGVLVQIEADDQSVCMTVGVAGKSAQSFYFGYPGTLTGSGLQSVLEACGIDSQYHYDDCGCEEPSHNDEVLCCPDCERPNQFGEVCSQCAREADTKLFDQLVITAPDISRSEDEMERRRR